MLKYAASSVSNSDLSRCAMNVAASGNTHSKHAAALDLSEQSPQHGLAKQLHPLLRCLGPAGRYVDHLYECINRWQSLLLQLKQHLVELRQTQDALKQQSELCAAQEEEIAGIQHQ
jgi:hypothetical protein